MSITTRLQHRPKGYTVIESLAVLGILAIFSMVVVALVIHDRKSDQPDDKSPAARNPAPAAPLSPADSGDESE